MKLLILAMIFLSSVALASTNPSTSSPEKCMKEAKAQTLKYYLQLYYGGNNRWGDKIEITEAMAEYNVPSHGNFIYSIYVNQQPFAVALNAENCKLAFIQDVWGSI